MNPLSTAALAALVILVLVRRPGGWAMAGSIVGGGSTGGGERTLGLWTEALASSPDLGHHLPAPVAAPTIEPTDSEARIVALVDLARAGDAEAFGELFEHFQGPIYRQLYFLTRSASLAEDLTSETFFRALRAMRKEQMPAAYVGPWLRRIARNLALDHWSAKSTRAERVTADFSWFEPGDSGAAIDAAVQDDFLRQALSRLPETQRRVLAMRFLCQMSIEETTAEIGCSYGATKQLQWRGLRNLERILRDQEVG